MTKRAGRSKPSVTTASPGRHSPMARQAACSRSAPAARWMAPSTPPPPSRRRFAALTTASTRSAVMSPCTAWSRGGMGRLPGAAGRRGGDQLEEREGAGGCRLALVLAPVGKRDDPMDGRRPSAAARVGHLLDRERGTGGRDVEHDGYLAPALGGDRPDDGRRLLAGHGGGFPYGERPTDLELFRHFRREQSADELGE